MRKILAILLAILPAACADVPALALSAPATLPYHTLYGRLGAIPGDTGPGSAIPFATLRPLLGATAGPGSATIGHIATWADTIGGTLADFGGTSGGIAYFSSTGAVASSAALTLNGPVIGGGAGTTPSTVAVGTNNQAFMGATGVAPSFRALVGADLPNPSASTLGGVESYVAVTHQWINSISTSGVPASTQPAIADISGWGTGVATALGNTLNAASGLVGFSGALGTPTSGVGTNLTGTAAGLTAGNVTTNANLTGPVTSAGNATTIGANQVSRANEAQGVARSVIGVTGNATANVADIQGAANQFLGVNSGGTALAFQTMSQDCTLATGVITCTKINNVSVSLGGTLTTAAAFTQAGAFATTITSTATSNSTLPAGTHTLAALDLTNQVVTGGMTVTPPSAQTTSFTANCGLGPIQTVTNNSGAYTITAPANDGFCLFKVTNGASAGATTFSGFSVGSNTGDALTTTNTNKFVISVIRAGGDSTYSVKALQ